MPRALCVFLATALTLAPVLVQAQSLQALVGQWMSAPSAGSVAFRLDSGGNCAVDTIEGICHVGADTITMRNANGALSYSYRVQGDTLTFSGGDLDRPVVFKRTAMAPPPPASPPAPAFSRPAAMPPPPPAFGGQHPILGRWVGQRGELVVATDGTLSLNGEPASRWQIQGRTLIVNSPDGSILNVPFDVAGNTLTAVVEGEQLRFQRQAGAPPPTAAGGRPPGAFGGGGGGGQELVGTWCYLGSVNALGGGRMSQRCINLRPDGGYTYQTETSTSTIYGGTSSAGSDSGTWRLQGGILYANSRREGPLQFRLEKRNHPRNGDPMICLDGDCYVTATQRRPW